MFAFYNIILFPVLLGPLLEHRHNPTVMLFFGPIESGFASKVDTGTTQTETAATSKKPGREANRP